MSVASAPIKAVSWTCKALHCVICVCLIAVVVVVVLSVLYFVKLFDFEKIFQ